MTPNQRLRINPIMNALLLYGKKLLGIKTDDHLCLCEMRWKNFGEMSTDEGHKVYFSGEEGKQEYGV